ncbi:MAG: hypothetical protein K5900_11440 [Butyrivibrio sp.]|nr:hypothetical protein [Butyrivibrio sp.]
MKSYEGRKRMVNRLVKSGGCLSTIMMAYGIWLMFTVRAQAYIDPSVMTYVIQAVAGVIIAVGAAIGIYFRRAKRKVQDKLGIDETKEQESDDIVVKK